MPKYQVTPTYPVPEKKQVSHQYRPTYMGKRAIPAAVVAAELASLDATGSLTAARVVDAATPRDAPLHEEFEWDDPTAAHKHRLGQAQALIKGIEVIIVSPTPQEPKDIRPMFFHVPARNPFHPGTYVTGEILIQDVTQYERALSEALRLLSGSERAFHQLRRLAEDMEETVQGQVSMAHEAFHFLRQALEALRQHRGGQDAAD
jgi:hypothetical protein